MPEILMLENHQGLEEQLSSPCLSLGGHQNAEVLLISHGIYTVAHQSTWDRESMRIFKNAHALSGIFFSFSVCKIKLKKKSNTSTNK